MLKEDLPALQGEITRWVETMFHSARLISRMSASAVSGLGASLIVASFVFAMITPGRLSSTEYVTTMIAGTVMILVGPLILARVRTDETKFATTVLKQEIDLRRDARTAPR
jgi:hypothetical protein